MFCEAHVLSGIAYGSICLWWWISLLRYTFIAERQESKSAGRQARLQISLKFIITLLWLQHGQSKLTINSGICAPGGCANTTLIGKIDAVLSLVLRNASSELVVNVICADTNKTLDAGAIVTLWVQIHNCTMTGSSDVVRCAYVCLWHCIWLHCDYVT